MARWDPIVTPYSDLSHPEWLDGKVPYGFWDDDHNHTRYMKWLAKKLKFKKTSDWYRTRHKDFSWNHGSGFLGYYGGSHIQAIKHHFPKVQWHDWLFEYVEIGFWDDPKNRKRYMQWLGKQLGYKKTDDWYQLTRRLLIENHAGGLVDLFRHSPQKILTDYMPEVDWKPWLFVSTQNNFWTKAEHRKQYLQWLEQQLGITDPDDWYEIKVRAFYDHHGGSLMKRMNDNIIKTLKDLYPRHRFYPWKFQQVAKRFWREKKNRLEYLRWLGKELGFKRQTDWLKLRAVDFENNHGETVFAEHYRRLFVKVVSELYPNRIWYEWDFHRVPPGFFKKKANRIRYLQWINKKLRIKHAEQWDTFRKKDFKQHCGAKFLSNYGGSLERAVSEAKQAFHLNQR